MLEQFESAGDLDECSGMYGSHVITGTVATEGASR